VDGWLSLRNPPPRRADHSAAQVYFGIPLSPSSAAAAAQVTAGEVSAMTQMAVALAVEFEGPMSTLNP
jgi:hypothetical protein